LVAVAVAALFVIRAALVAQALLFFLPLQPLQP
jgi:hypothetical protein